MRFDNRRDNCFISIPNCPDRIPTRVSIGVMLLLAMASTCTMRTNMSVNILAMTNADSLNGTAQQLPDVRDPPHHNPMPLSEPTLV